MPRRRTARLASRPAWTVSSPSRSTEKSWPRCCQNRQPPGRRNCAATLLSHRRRRRRHSRCRNLLAGGDPFVPGLHADSETAVIHPHIAIAAAHHGIRHDGFDFLRHHTHIGLLAAVVAEAVEAETVIEMAE